MAQKQTLDKDYPVAVRLAMTPSTFASYDTPLIVVPENIPEASDLFTVSVEVMQIDDRPFMRVINKESGKEVLIPERMFKAIEREGKANFRQARLDLSGEQCKYANIESSFPELKPSNKLSTSTAPCYSLHDDANEIIEGTALLRFIPDLGKKETENGSRWALVLKDYDKQLSSVAWNDKEGLLNLVNSMKDPEPLSVQLALSDPEAGIRLTNTLRIRALAKEFRETLVATDLPEISARKISKVLRSDDQIKTLIKRNRSGMKDMIRTVYVEKDGVEFPIALEVKFSYRYSDQTKEEFEKRILELAGCDVIPLSKKNDNKLTGNDHSGYKYKLDKGFWITPKTLFPLVNNFSDALPTTAKLSDAKSWL